MDTHRCSTPNTAAMEDACTTTANSGSEELLTSPLELRPPLQVVANTNTTQQDLVDHSSKIRPLLYRMFVACHILRFGTEARFTALVLLHRYTIATKNEPKDRLCESKWVAAACLFLACKTEEEPRRLRDVINLAWMILAPPSSSSTPNNRDKKEYSLSGKGQVDKSGDGIEGSASNDDGNQHLEILEISNDPPELNEEYWQSKKKIVQTEQIVLRWLAFDVSVSHPHRAIGILVKHETSDTREKLQAVGYRRLNDALFHAPAMMHGVLPLACAALVLAIEEELDNQNALKSKGLVLSTHLSVSQWWKVYQVSNEDVTSAKVDLVQATKLLETN